MMACTFQRAQPAGRNGRAGRYPERGSTWQSRVRHKGDDRGIFMLDDLRVHSVDLAFRPPVSTLAMSSHS